MPLEIDSSTKPVVNARSYVNQARRSRADNQIASDTDFYAELLRFQTREAEPPVRSPDPEPTPATPVESKARTQDTGEGEADDSREPEQNETTDSDSQSIASTAVATPSERILDHAPTTKTAKSKQNAEEVRTDESAVDQNKSNLNDDRARVTASTAADRRQGDNKDAHALKEENNDPKKLEVIAKRNDDHDPKRQGTKQQETQSNERPVAQTADRKSDDRADSETTSRKKLGESELKTPQVIDHSSETREMATEEKVNLRASDKKRAEINSDSNAQGSLNAQSTRIEAGMVSKANAKQEKNSERLTTPNAETNATSEPSRTRRKSDRNGSRNRSFSDPAREPSDRPISADRSPSSRVESASATHSRDVDSSRSTDPASLTASSVSAWNASSTTSTPAAIPTPAATTAFAASSPSPGVSDTSSAKASSKPDSISQSSPAVSSTSASTPETSTARGPAGATGSAGPRLTQYQETKLVQRVLRGMEQLANGGGQVRLRLHPPELGSLQMSLRIEGAAVFAEMKVETTSARDALMKNLPVLKERLAEQGMNVQHFDVRADGNFDGGNFNTSSQRNQSGSDSNSERQTSRAVTELQNRLPTQPVGAAVETGTRWIRSHGQLDFQA